MNHFSNLYLTWIGHFHCLSYPAIIIQIPFSSSLKHLISLKVINQTNIKGYILQIIFEISKFILYLQENKKKCL